jgi:hypothetical protein
MSGREKFEVECGFSVIPITYSPPKPITYSPPKPITCSPSIPISVLV